MLLYTIFRTTGWQKYSGTQIMLTSKWELCLVYNVSTCLALRRKSHLQVKKICVPEYLCHPVLNSLKCKAWISCITRINYGKPSYTNALWKINLIAVTDNDAVIAVSCNLDTSFWWQICARLNICFFAGWATRPRTFGHAKITRKLPPKIGIQGDGGLCIAFFSR